MLSSYKQEDFCLLDGLDEIAGIKTYNILKYIFLRTIYAMAQSKGFVIDSNNNLVFPRLEGNTAFYKFVSYDDSQLRIAPHGYKTIRGVRFNYSLAFRPRIAVIEKAWCVIVSLHLHLSDNRGIDVERKFIPTIRKHIVRSWWNHEWFVRHMAISARLSGDEKNWIYPLNDKERLQVSRIPMTGISETALDDDMISRLAKERQQKYTITSMTE